MGLPPDEHLPEVVPDTSPQVLSGNEAQQNYMHLVERDPKYPVIVDDTPKLLKDEDDTTLSPAAAAAAAVSAQSPAGTIPWEPQSAAATTPGADPESPGGAAAGAGEGRICGLKRKTFWIVLAVVLVVLVAAIGGGVGGGLAARNSKAASGAEAGAAAGASETPTPTSGDPSSTETSTSATPTVSDLNDLSPSKEYQFQAWTEPDFKGNKSQVYNMEGFFDFGFTAKSYIFRPKDSGCCLTFCRNKTHDAGWACQERFQTEASRPFTRLRVTCLAGQDGALPCSTEAEAEKEKEKQDDDDDE